MPLQYDDCPFSRGFHLGFISKQSSRGSVLGNTYCTYLASLFCPERPVPYVDLPAPGSSPVIWERSASYLTFLPILLFLHRPLTLLSYSPLFWDISI
jgi:hypothetical protein